MEKDIERMSSVRMPSVAVCIVTWNSAEWIEDCLACVARQTWPNLHVVVVDNASQDDTLRHIERSGVPVRLLRNERNEGFAAGQNRAIMATDADYCLVLNPDVRLAPDYVEKLVRRMEERPDIGSAAGCLVLKADPSLVDSAGLDMLWTRRVVERGAGRPAAAFGEPTEVFGVSGAAAMYARRMIREVAVDGQFFDEDFFAYKEDVDVAWRARRLGWRAWYEPAARAEHARGWGRRSDRRRIPLVVRRHSYKNRYLMILKNESFGPAWWLRLPGLLAVELAWHAYLLGRDPAVLGAWPQLIRLIPRAWRKRRALRQMLRMKEQRKHLHPGAIEGSTSAEG